MDKNRTGPFVKMDERRRKLQGFLAETKWHGLDIVNLAGDASNRRYFRGQKEGMPSIVIMDAPPNRGEDVRPFIQVSEHLASVGLSAPQILAADEALGFLVLEDLGDDLFARIVERDPSQEIDLYLAATDVLLTLAREEPPTGFERPLDHDELAALTGIAAIWYAGNPPAERVLTAALAKSLSSLDSTRPALKLRDFHAENLLWLPDRAGVARVGLLDFQDAQLGHPTYDLASLLRDARRDVSPETQDTVLTYFAESMGWSTNETSRAMSAHGAQRNLRILGVFARLSLHFGKARYVDMIPRVWKNLMEELSHPDLRELKEVVTNTLPPPTPEILKDLRDRCGMIPTLA